MEAETQAPTAGAQAAPPPTAPPQAPGRAAPVHATQTDAAPDEVSGETDGAPAKRRKRGPRSAPQYRARVDQDLFVVQVQKQIGVVRAAEPALAALLLEHGITPEYLAALEAQLAATLAANAARTEAIVAEQVAIKAMEERYVVALTALTTMRQVARTALPDRSMFSALTWASRCRAATHLFVEWRVMRCVQRGANPVRHNWRRRLTHRRLRSERWRRSTRWRLRTLRACTRAPHRRRPGWTATAACASCVAWCGPCVQMRALLRHHPEFVTPAWF